MVARHIPASSSLPVHEQELLYSLDRLEADPDTRDLAAMLEPLLGALATVHAAQKAAWRDENRGDAAVRYADQVLDDAVDALWNQLLFLADRRTDDPRVRTYFPKPRSEVVRLGLQSQLAVVGSWPTALAGEPEPELQALGVRLQQAIDAGQAAVSRRADAVLARATQKAREVLLLKDDIQAARQSVYGELVRRAAAARRPRSWADGFFRTASRAAAETDEDEDLPAEA